MEITNLLFLLLLFLFITSCCRSANLTISRAKINSVKQTLVIIACYILCSTPFIVGQLLATLGPPHISSQIEMQMQPLFWLMTLNSLVNPWIYIWFNRNHLFSSEMEEIRRSHLRM